MARRVDDRLAMFTISRRFIALAVTALVLILATGLPASAQSSVSSSTGCAAGSRW